MKKHQRHFVRASCILAVLLASVIPITLYGARGGGGKGGGGGNPTTFSGRAVAVDATVLGMRTTVSDTGPLPSSGGALEASLLTVNVPGILTGEVAHATTIGQGDGSRSEASLADANLTVAGHTITADLLMSRALALCQAGNASSSGSSELANLVIDGQAITVSGAPNQTITLPLGAGYVIINEQTSTGSRKSSSITVNALHVVLFDPATGGTLADVILASAHADISCGNGVCTGGDFITGGGYIVTATSPRDTFGVAGGIKNGGFWGHLTYIDHGTGMRVKGTGVTAYSSTGLTSRHIEGTAEVNGQGGFTYMVDLADNGEPGRADTFAIRLSNGYTASGTLVGGNIQLHKPCR